MRNLVQGLNRFYSILFLLYSDQQIKEEFTDAQNHAQKVCDELSNRLVYIKFIGGFNKESVLLENPSVVGDSSIQVGSGTSKQSH